VPEEKKTVVLVDDNLTNLAIGAAVLKDTYRVMSIPTLILFKDGEAAAVSVGAAPKEELLRRIEPYL
jgi:hypothetical protein